MRQKEVEDIFQHIDRMSPEILRALVDAPVFQKQMRVKARKATTEEKITTTLNDGTQETVNTAHEGDWIITNPSGEQYIISKEKFFDQYRKTDTDGVYVSNDYCRAIPNPFKKPIKITASWGSTQKGDANCLIADTCDANGMLAGEPYLIDAEAFTETYKKV